MKNKKENTLKLLLSSLLVISALLVIIIIIMIPDRSKNETSDPENIASLQESGKPADNTFPQSSYTPSEEYPDSDIHAGRGTETVSEITSATHPVAEQKNEQKMIAMQKNISASSIRRKEKKLYFIIDDAGYNIDQLKPFLEFPGSITVAVLPGLPHSRECAELIHKSGKQVFLHQPMEALGKNNPGPDAILLEMNNSEIIDILNKNLESIPFAAGFNNHMGSAITSNASIMETILRTALKKKVFFTDSMTTADSKSKEVAEKLGITIAKRDVFLDNVDNREAIMESLNTGLNIAENKGHAVMIGHVWSSELADTMMEIYPNLIEDGFTLEEMSDLILGDM